MDRGFSNLMPGSSLLSHGETPHYHRRYGVSLLSSTAASRRSLDRVSVPVWLVILSDQLGIVALVSRYPTNKLIPSGHIRWQEARGSPSLVLRRYAVLATVSSSYPPPSGSFPDITHPSATRQRNSKLFPVTVRLACVRPAASVQSEP